MKIEKSEKICAFCESAVPLYDGDTVLCDRCGIVSKDHSCKKFSYDPLKRTPPKAQSLPTLEFIDIND